MGILIIKHATIRSRPLNPRLGFPDKLPRAFCVAPMGVCPSQSGGILMHNGNNLNAILVLFHCHRRPRPDLGSSSNVFQTNIRTVVHFCCLITSTQEVQANTVSLLLSSSTRSCCTSSDSDDAPAGAGASAGRGKDLGEVPHHAGLERRQAGTNDADVDFQVTPERGHRVIPADVFRYRYSVQRL